MSGSTIFMGLVVAAMIALAVFVAARLEPGWKERCAATHARNRAAFFAGTLREDKRALPAAAMEVRVGEQRARLLAVYEDGVTAFLQWGPRASAALWTPKEPRLDGKQRRFVDAIAKGEDAAGVPAGGAMPPVGMAVAYRRRGDALIAGAPVPLDDVRGGRHALSGAWEVWGSLSQSWRWWMDT